MRPSYAAGVGSNVSVAATSAMPVGQLRAPGGDAPAPRRAGLRTRSAGQQRLVARSRSPGDRAQASSRERGCAGSAALRAAHPRVRIRAAQSARCRASASDGTSGPRRLVGPPPRHPEPRRAPAASSIARSRRSSPSASAAIGSGRPVASRRSATRRVREKRVLAGDAREDPGVHAGEADVRERQPARLHRIEDAHAAAVGSRRRASSRRRRARRARRAPRARETARSSPRTVSTLAHRLGRGAEADVARARRARALRTRPRGRRSRASRGRRPPRSRASAVADLGIAPQRARVRGVPEPAAAVEQRVHRRGVGAERSNDDRDLVRRRSGGDRRERVVGGGLQLGARALCVEERDRRRQRARGRARRSARRAPAIARARSTPNAPRGVRGIRGKEKRQLAPAIERAHAARRGRRSGRRRRGGGSRRSARRTRRRCAAAARQARRRRSRRLARASSSKRVATTVA